jgi:NAD(P) transhydrogenase
MISAMSDGVAAERRIQPPDETDLVVIGSGPAGEKAAAHAAYFGKRVLMVERAALGGAVVHSGGIPTKTLRETALYLTGFRQRHVYGVSAALDRDLSLHVLRARTASVVESMEQRVRLNLERHGVEVLHGHATLVAADQVEVDLGGARPHTVRAPVILIASGSRPFHPPGLPMDDPDVFDSDQLLLMDRPFDSIAIIGGGGIGCEYASIFAALGVRVTIIDQAPQLAPMMDAEISDLLAASLSEVGVEIHLGDGVSGVERNEGRLEVRLVSGAVVHADKVLVSVGRVGNTSGMGLERVGVEVDARSRIVVDANFQTTCPGIYAAGDVIGPPALASVSIEQGRRAISAAFATPLHTGHFFEPPFAVYSIPEAARVGMTEQEAIDQGIACEVGRAWLGDNARANIAGVKDGLVKLVFRRYDRQLLGVHILGETAAEMVHLGQAVLQHGGSIDYFVHATFNVPTWTDAYKYAAFDGLQRVEPGRPLRGIFNRTGPAPQ